MATNPMTDTALVNNGAMSKSLTSGKAQVINIAPGDHYRIVENQNGKLTLKDNLVAKRVGDDLVVTYADGTEVIIEDYFVTCADQSCSATFAADEAAGYDLPADATGASMGDGSSMVYAHGNSETLMGMAQGNSAMSSVLTAGTLDAGLLTYIPAAAGMGMGVGLLGLAGAGVAAGGGGGGGGSTPDTTPPEPPVINDPTVNDDGTITIAGTAEPGSTVTVTFPDGTTKTVETDPDGNYGPVTSDGPQSDGSIKAIATDPAGNPSEPTENTYTDVTPPAAPSTPTVDTNPDGTITITGTAEPGTTVTVTLPDGTTIDDIPVGPDGSYGPVTSDDPQPSGPITVVATDPAGNPSDPTETPYADITPPAVPSTPTVDTNPDGTITITGTAEPGTTVTVTLPDGTTIDDIPVGPDGSYGPVTSDDPQPSGPITVVATDPAGNPSDPTETPYADITPPAVPSTPTVDTNPDGTITITGTAEPGTTVTVTL
ncbi:MAG: Ig-like domain-containing protein, partial [Candidatus Sedimenticola sp. 20ELBAFRAG]